MSCAPAPSPATFTVVVSSVSSRAAAHTPGALAYPPAITDPPSTTTAMDVSSYGSPMFSVVPPEYPASSSPAIAAQTPLMT